LINSTGALCPPKRSVSGAVAVQRLTGARIKSPVTELDGAQERIRVQSVVAVFVMGAALQKP